MSFFEKQGNSLCCRLNGETIRLIPWGKNSLRVVAKMINEPELPDWALLPQEEQQSEITLSEKNASIRVGKIKAVVAHHPWPSFLKITYYNQNDEVLLAEKEYGGALQRLPRHFKAQVAADYKLTVSFEAYDNEKLFGMGQYQQSFLDIKNCNFELAHRNSQASVPFVMSNRGYGFLWHNPAVGSAKFGKNGTEWIADSATQTDYWITAGDTPAEIEQQFADAVGKPPVMPEYGLGYWQCKLRYWNQEQLLETAREYKKRGIPLDVIVCDFFHWPRMGDFRFDEEFFPNPDAMVKELKELGIELMVSIWPQISLNSENFMEMKEKGLLVSADKGVNVSMQFQEDSVFYDATNPAARQYVWEKCKQNYYDKGIKVFWLDEAEPEYAGFDFDNYRYYSGTNVQTGNIYPQQYSRGFYEGMQAAGQKEIVNLVRCAWVGSQRYGALVWSGDIHSDWPTFKSQICAGLSMGVAGIPWWTTDIGGFHGGNPQEEGFRELLIRWFQWGAFCPVMRMHGDRQPAEQILRKDGSRNCHTGGPNEIWDYGDEAYEILKKYIAFRETMRPYTRQLMREANEIGSPVMRAMFYEFPKDSTCWDLIDQYMFGADLLCAPVTEPGAAQRMVYLPEGARWTELRTGKVYEGGQHIQADAPIDYMPVFIRDDRHPDFIGTL